MMRTAQPGLEQLERGEGSLRRLSVSSQFVLDDVPHIAEYVPGLKVAVYGRRRPV